MKQQNNNQIPGNGNFSMNKSSKKTTHDINSLSSYKNFDSGKFSCSQLNFKNETNTEQKQKPINNFNPSLSPIKKVLDKNNVLQIPSLNFNKLNKSTNNNIVDNTGGQVT